jgi:uncharacterized protein (TIGR03083 family)
MTRDEIWDAIHEERRRLASDLAALDDSQWTTASLCHAWTVEEVVAHLTAGALETRWRWIRSAVAARFDFALHNQRQLRQHLGPTPQDTLRSFNRAATSTTAASNHHWAWLGEILVHGEDIRRPLGIPSPTAPMLAREVAIHFVNKNFTVESKSHVAGLHLNATDIAFEHGNGPDVSGPILSLLMVMSGRSEHLTDLNGDGLAQLTAAIVATPPTS